MKKITVLIYFLLYLSTLISQNGLHFNFPTPLQKTKPDFKTLRGSTISISNKKTSSIHGGWFNYGLAAQNYYAIASDVSTNYLFPDSIASGEFGGGVFSAMYIHHLAELVDFRSSVFQFNPATDWVTSNSTSTIVLDSLSIAYNYTRVQTNITDTLIFTLFDGPLTGVGTYSIRGTSNFMGYPGGADTICYKDIGYNQTSNTIAAASNTTTAPVGQKVFKVLLNQPDTAVTTLREKAFVIPFSFISNRNHLVTASVQFKPGYTYSLTEHVNYTANVFSFASLEENGNGGGTGSLMYYNDCGYGSVLCDYSKSYILQKDIQYNYPPLSYWHGHFVPSLVFTEAYAYEHHLISFHVTDDTTNICMATAQFNVFPDTLVPGNYTAINNSGGTGSVSYLWDFGDNTTSNQQYPTHQYAIPGQYIVCLTVSATSGTNACSDTYCDSSSVHRMAAGFIMSQFNVIPPQIVTDAKQLEYKLNVSAYPNPVTDELIIESTTTAALHYMLTDAIGRTVFSGSLQTDKTTLNTTKLAKGFYSLQIVNANGKLVKTIKLIK